MSDLEATLFAHSKDFLVSQRGVAPDSVILTKAQTESGSVRVCTRGTRPDGSHVFDVVELST